MATEQILAVVGIGFYVLASILSVASPARPAPANERWTLLLMLLGSMPLVAVLGLHGIRDGRIPAFGRFEAITWYSLAVSAAFAYLALRHRARGIAGIVVPYVTVLLCIGAPAVRHQVGQSLQTQNVWLGLHIVTSFVGYAFFTLASVLAIVYLIQDHNLKHRRFGTTFNMFPSLETLDRLMYRQIGFAFLMFTIAVALGFLLSQQIGWPPGLLTDPKIVATLATWFVYASLFHLRTFGDRHGRRMAIATVVGLGCVLFTFVGVHLLTDSVHDFVLTNLAGN